MYTVTKLPKDTGAYSVGLRWIVRLDDYGGMNMTIGYFATEKLARKVAEALNATSTVELC